jgi:hypothetical protein
MAIFSPLQVHTLYSVYVWKYQRKRGSTITIFTIAHLLPLKLQWHKINPTIKVLGGFRGYDSSIKCIFLLLFIFLSLSCLINSHMRPTNKKSYCFLCLFCLPENDNCKTFFVVHVRFPWFYINFPQWVVWVTWTN